MENRDDNNEMSELSLGEVLEVGRLFEQHGIRYWLDSGTLLGIIRDGHMLSGDDIDIGMWDTDGGNLAPLLLGLRKRYSVRTRRYCGKIVAYWLQPKRARQRSIDIKMFHREGGFAWCPSVQAVDRFTDNRYAFWVWRLVRGLTWRIWLYLLPKIPADTWPLRYFVTVCCWWIPARFFDAIRILDNGLRVPLDTDDYLRYRYGDWRIPVTNWDYRVNDPAFRRSSPEDLISEVNTPPLLCRRNR